MATDISVFSDRCTSSLTSCPGPLIDQAVVDAIIQFFKDTYIFKRNFEVAITSGDVDTADNNAVTIDLSLISGNPYANKRPLDIVSPFRIDNAPFKIEKAEMDTQITNLDHIRYGTKRFFNFPSTTEIKIFPLEVQDADIFLEVVFAPIITITDIDDFIFNEHHKAIEAHTKYELMRQKNKPWTDQQESVVQWGIYSKEMGEARIRVEQQYTQRSTMVQSKYIF